MRQLILVSFLIAFNTKADDYSDINLLLDGLHEDAHKGNLRLILIVIVQMLYF